MDGKGSRESRSEGLEGGKGGRKVMQFYFNQKNLKSISD